MTVQPTLDDQLVALLPNAIDPFSRKTIEGARRALADKDNPLRLNFFCAAMRILFEHMMSTLAPVDEVVKAPWFVAERPDNFPTRSQRIAFVVQGGLSDVFVRNTLKIDVKPLRSRLIRAVDELSKHVHARENTIVEDAAAQDAEALATIDTLRHFLETYHECRRTIVESIQQEIDDTAIDALISETILEVDELASHHSIDEVYIDRTLVKTIGASSIVYRAEGSIAVGLQWGSNSDVERGDGLEIDQSFPFHCDITALIEDPFDLRGAETSYEVDTTKWREGG